MKPQIILALDVNSLAEIRDLSERLGKEGQYYKIGSQLFTAIGPPSVRFLLAKGKNVFLDLKFHDIPNTVASAVESAVGLSEQNKSVFMMTLHTLGGVEMMKAAMESAKKAANKLKVERPLLVGVTVLTSQGGDDNIAGLVLERAKLAKQAGLDGVVASAQEAAMLKKEFGKDFVIVTPGIRPSGGDVQDQKRVMTAKDAVKAGSHFLVVGRPVLQAPDPVKAMQDLLKEIA